VARVISFFTNKVNTYFLAFFDAIFQPPAFANRAFAKATASREATAWQCEWTSLHVVSIFATSYAESYGASGKLRRDEPAWQAPINTKPRGAETTDRADDANDEGRMTNDETGGAPGDRPALLSGPRHCGRDGEKRNDREVFSPVFFVGDNQ
jgi:hypothetical protein